MNTLNLKLALVLILVTIFNSCKENGNTNPTFTNGDETLTVDEVVEKITNDNVQKTFYGTTFGESKSDVLINFENHGLAMVPQLSNNTSSCFVHKKYKTIDFGGMPWEFVVANYDSNDSFIGISFSYNFSNKDLALQELERRHEIVMKKYETISFENDPLNYVKVYRIVGKGCGALLFCDEHEGLDHNLWYGVFLNYSLDSDIVSEEL